MSDKKEKKEEKEDYGYHLGYDCLTFFLIAILIVMGIIGLSVSNDSNVCSNKHYAANHQWACGD